MSEIVVRVLGEDDWQTYRDTRLAALQESPDAFAARYEDEATEDEHFWRDRMRRSVRFLAELDGVPAGVVSLGRAAHDPELRDGADAGEIFGLYVTPQARNTGTSWRLVHAAAIQAQAEGLSRILYWVGTENARAIAFAANFGFRPSGERRSTRVVNEEYGEQEVAMTLSLSADPGSVPNPNRGRATPKEGPVR